VLVRGDTGERIPLVGATVTVGRSRDRDITIDDTRVSRSHARFEAGRNGWSVLDEGSANGTQVANTELVPNQPRSLRIDDVIAIGPVGLRVTAGPSGGPGREAGTRALDDRDRHRISGEVLPPDRDRGS
jgi:pSer/pThr/pTyr-binding forkhead associated (FHA) protein